MPARTSAPRHDGALLLTLTNDGRELETQIAASGEHAIKVGVLMLCHQDVLRPGDMLRVTASATADGVQLPRRRVI